MTATLLALLLAGLASSLHCIGMCGPILVGFSQAFTASAALTVNGAPLDAAPPRRASIAWDFVFYHAGRLWTYATLGLLAGLAGQRLRDSAAWLGWQKPLGIAIAAAVIVTGLLLAGLVPRLPIARLTGDCGVTKLRTVAWFSMLLRQRGAMAKLLLGAVMGLIPCGLVYAMLVLVSALPSPLHAALGMLAFGVGTLPSLSAALLAANLVPLSWRRHGTRLAAVFVVLAGGWMMFRALTPPAHCHDARDAACCQVAATQPLAADAPAATDPAD